MVERPTLQWERSRRIATALYAVKAGTSAATAYLAERISKKHPKRAVVLMAVLNSAYVAIVAHNYRVASAGR